MLISTALLAAIAVSLVGISVLWSNPTRLVNRLVFTCSINIAAWLLCLHLAASTVNAVFWIRSACAVGALLPYHYWLISQSITGHRENPRRRYNNAAWLLLSLGLAVICYTEYFIPSYSTPSTRVRGWGYYTYIATVIVLYSYVLIDGFRSMKSLAGVRRLELQVWVGGGCATALTIFLTIAANAITHDPIYIRARPIVAFLYFGFTAYAITTFRIFDARQLILVASEKLLLVATVALSAYSVGTLLMFVLPELLALFFTTALSLLFAAELNSRLDRIFRFYPQSSKARQAAFIAAQRETRVDGLESAFSDVLKGWGQTDHALILSGRRENLAGGGVDLPESSGVASAMRSLRWATPERLARERPSLSRKLVADFLSAHSLGAAVLAEGPSLMALIGVGHSASRRPLTYPQVTQLMELASIMEGALERAHFSAKAQHSEQLATVGLLGASLAHEIRNPLVTIKTFVQLLPKHHQDAAFRDKFFRLIGDEVGRIDQLTEQLLDLASPRTYEAKMIELHPVLTASLDLVAAKASHMNVRFLTDFKAAPDRAFTDASAAKQVMLNLCFNAIQAAESHDTPDRWVKIATRNTSAGIEMAVADSGLGIAPEIRPVIFHPFQTTKSSGFGLGLAICSDILGNLNASITVDPPVTGCGATFRVTFPCQPQSS